MAVWTTWAKVVLISHVAEQPCPSWLPRSRPGRKAYLLTMVSSFPSKANHVNGLLEASIDSLFTLALGCMVHLVCRKKISQINVHDQAPSC